jgi:tetratricopeptide (TPR) repeat protein
MRSAVRALVSPSARCSLWIAVGLFVAGPSVPLAGGGQAATPNKAATLSSSWRQIVTPELTVVGNARDGELKRILADLNAFRATMSSLFPGIRTTSPVPTRVVVFKDTDAFARFRPRDGRGKPLDNVGGYFTQEPETNLLVLPFARSEHSYGIIFHEYAHYLIHRNVRSFVPTWVDEGLAEFYSTFEPDYKGQSLLGRAPGARVQSLRVGTFMPLSEVVSPREMEKTWRTGNRIEMFYAEAWALVHYLIVGRKDTPASFGTYLSALAKASSQDAAFKEAFGVDVDGIERELRPYVSRFTFPALMLPRVADRSTSATTGPMQEADVRQLEGSLLAHVGATDEAEKELQAALTMNPDHIDARVALAAVRLTQGRHDEAITSLSEVTRAAPTHLAAQYYLGVAFARSWRHQEAIAAFDRSLKLNPDHTFSWRGLSSSALALKRDVHANAAFQQAQQRDPNPAFYLSHARMALRVGRDDAAAVAARSYIDRVGLSDETAQYASFLAAIASWRAGQSGDADSILSDARGAIPVKSWTFSVVQFLQGQLAADRFLAMAGDVGQRTEAHTYVGFKADLAGRHEEALTHFRWVVEHGARTYAEYDLARNEIDRIQHATMPR